jgi:anti-sigma factor ChrR (cupin superfamily)
LAVVAAGKVPEWVQEVGQVPAAEWAMVSDQAQAQGQGMAAEGPAKVAAVVDRERDEEPASAPAAAQDRELVMEQEKEAGAARVVAPVRVPGQAHSPAFPLRVVVDHWAV